METTDPMPHTWTFLLTVVVSQKPMHGIGNKEQDSSGLMAMGKEVLLLDVLEVRVLMDGVAWLWYFDTVTGERWSVINLDESLLTKGQTDASSRNNGFVHLNE